MSLFNRLTYYVFIAEVLIYLLSLIPLNFVAVRTRKTVMRTFHRIFENSPVIIWTTRLVLIIVSTVFLDTILRLKRMEEDMHAEKSNDAIDKSAYLAAANAAPGGYADLQLKTRLFYSQRNMYLSLFSLFMVLVLYTRFKEIYSRLSSLETIEIKQAEIDRLVLKTTLVNDKPQSLKGSAIKPDIALASKKETNVSTLKHRAAKSMNASDDELVELSEMVGK